MPFALVFLGLVMVVSGAKNTHRELGAEVIQDFTGSGNFTWWIIAIGAVGAVGYYAPARNFSRAFMALIVIAMVLAQQRSGGGGFFGQLEAALKSGPVSPSSSDGSLTPGAGVQKDIVPISIPVTDTNAQAQANFGKTMQVVKLFFGMP